MLLCDGRLCGILVSSIGLIQIVMNARRSMEGLYENEEVCTMRVSWDVMYGRMWNYAGYSPVFLLDVNLESGSISTKSSPASAQSKYGL